jgi:hypothetical protein
LEAKKIWALDTFTVVLVDKATIMEGNYLMHKISLLLLPTSTPGRAKEVLLNQRNIW